MPGDLERSVVVRAGADRGRCHYAPVVTRLRSYAVQVDPVCAAYSAHVWAWPDLAEWVAAARLEPEQIEELEVEF